MTERGLNQMPDLSGYLEKRLLEMKDVTQRKAVRDLCETVLKEAAALPETDYYTLEKQGKLFGSRKQETVVVYTGMMDKNTCLTKDAKLYPVIPEAVNEIKVETGELLEAVGKKEKVKAGTFFLEADYKMAEQLGEQRQVFHGTVYTKNLPYHITVEVRPDKRYREIVKTLYDVFVQNEIPWRTLCVPYFHKMFEYFYTDTDLPWYEQIESVEIDFEEYGSCIREEMIPVWNIEPVRVVSDQRPQMDSSRGQYRHVINPKRLQQDCTYLAAETNLQITGCSRERGLTLFCSESKPRIWNLYCVKQDVPIGINHETGYEIFGNKTKNPGIHPARTVGGIIRLVSQLGYQERFELLKTGLTEEKGTCLTYSMNENWDEEFCYENTGPVLTLTFKSKVQDYLQTDILSYLLSEVQRQYPMYHCTAELV